METQATLDLININPEDPNNKDFLKIQEMFNKEYNTDEVITILKCHLMVEHCLAEYLTHYYDQEIRLNINKLTFNQKLQILPSDDYIYNGLKELNEIRNNLAHRLKPLKESDIEQIKKVILKIPFEVRNPDLKDEPPIFFILHFSLFASFKLILNKKPKSNKINSIS